MRLPLASISVFLVLCPCPCAAPSLGVTHAAGPDRFVGLRVCGATAFSRSEARCSRDERHTAITSNRISCSARLVAKQSGVWRARFRYAGAVEPWGRGGKVAKGGDVLLVANANIRTNQPLPGGDWACEFA